MDTNSTAAAAMFNALVAATGAWITLTRGSASVSVIALAGRSRLEVVDDNGDAGGRIEAVSHDWIVRAADLVISGALIEPTEGDRITRVLGTRTLTYELMTPPFSPSDANGVLIRIHCKQIA